MREPCPIAVGLTVTAALLAFSTLLVCESYLLYVHRGAWSSAASFLLRVPFLLLEHAVVAAVLGALAALLAGRGRWLRGGFLLVVAALGAYLVANQVVYRLFFSPAHLSQSEGSTFDVATVWDSFVAELDPTVYLNFAALAGVTIVIGRALSGHTGRPARWLAARWRTLALASVVWATACVVVTGRATTHRLDRHPLVALFEPTRSPARLATATLDDLALLRFGRPTIDPDGAALPALATRIRARPTPPSVLMIVLESVGALQLLPDGQLDATRTPHLARWGSRALIFDSIYVSFPSTARTHLALTTGGQTFTWGTVGRDLVAAYAGPTLAGELHARGYRTALFAAPRLDFENLGRLYAGQAYDTRIGYDDLPASVRARDQVHSWGGDERVTWDEARAWIDGAPGPWFVHLLTNGTHHPYGAPARFAGTRHGDDRQGRYLDALGYTDQVLGEILDELTVSHRLDDTIVIITGDHGQAFGDRHADNLGHKNHLYEENIRSFAIVLAPEIPGPITVSRPGQIGDLFPTLVGLLGARPALDVPGQDLFSPTYQQRIAYFHKLATPAQWGLRDGHWKFIGSIDGTGGRLFDLARDPSEQHDLARTHPAQVRTYHQLCSAWYFAAQDAFIARTPLADDDLRLRPEHLRRPGPKVARFGMATGPDPDDFEVAPSITSRAPVVQVRWVPMPQPIRIRVTWVGPDQSITADDLDVFPDWTVTRHVLPRSPPIAAGRWRVVIADPDHVLLRAEFDVLLPEP